jgi:RNA polymerase sigma factor (sigma-70 family)
MNTIRDVEEMVEVTTFMGFRENIPDSPISDTNDAPLVLPCTNHLESMPVVLSKGWLGKESYRAPSVSRSSSVTTPSSTVQRDALYAEFRPLVNRLIRKYGDNAELRKDLEGEIFCLFCNLLDAYDPNRGVPLKPYLVHQLTASVYTLARRRWRREQHEISLELREDTSQAVDPSAEWDEQIAMQGVREMLPEAIARLPLRQRQVVIWRYYEHRSFEEIALTLGIQIATSRSILRHGLNNLRRAFAKANMVLEDLD